MSKQLTAIAKDDCVTFHDLAARARANAHYMLSKFRENRQYILARAADREQMTRALDRIESRLVESEAAEAGEMMRLREIIGRSPLRRQPEVATT